jgi:hypothetical protein
MDVAEGFRVSDIFHEIEEEVRRERYAQLWKRYGDYILAAAALIVVGVAAWQLWSRYQSNQRVDASNKYIVALETQDPAKAASAFAKLGQTAPDGYALLSRMQEANSLQAAGRTEQAAALYRKLMKESDPLFASVARLRLAWAQADTMSKKDMHALLDPLTGAGNSFRYMANELLAYADYRDGDVAAAQTEYEALAKEKDASDGIKERAHAMAAFLAAGGLRNVGRVPPPPPKPAEPSTTASSSAPSSASASAPTPAPAKNP